MAIRFHDSAPALTVADLDAAQSRLGVVLPADYREFLLRQNGGVPRPSKFGFRECGEISDDPGQRISAEIERFFSVGGKGRFAQFPFDLETARGALTDWSIPAHLLPIALVDDDFSGGVLCVSCSTSDAGGISYVMQDEHGECAVHYVASSLPALFDAMSKRKRELPAWVQAIDEGDVEAVRRWLDEGGSFSETYRDVITPLDRAVQEEQLDIVKLLIERGDSVEAAYEHATSAGKGDVLQYLLTLPDGQRCAAKTAFTAFRGAAADFFRDVDRLRQLITLGASVNRTADSDYTPLQLVAAAGTPEALRLFLDNGARPGEWSEYGELALHRAIFSSTREEMLSKMKMLIDAGEDLHVRAPISALSERVRTIAARLQAPSQYLHSRTPELANFLESLPGGKFETALAQRGGAFLQQYQRTAAEALIEFRRDPAALKELEDYADRRSDSQAG